MVEHGTCVSVSQHVRKDTVIQPPCVAQSFHFAVEWRLLPVEPPKVNAHLFERTKLRVEPCGHEFLVAGLPGYVLFRSRIYTQGRRHFRVMLFVCFNTVGGMQIERNLQIVLFEPAKKA